MAQNNSLRRRGPSSHHMLIASTYIGGHDLEDHSVIAFSTTGADEFREVDTLNFHFARSHIGDSTIACHGLFAHAHPLFKGCGASFCHGMILLARPPTHTDGANHLAVSCERDAARKDHDSAIVGRMDPKKLSAGLVMC